MNRGETIALMVLNRVTNYTPLEKRVLVEESGSAAGALGSAGGARQARVKPLKINGAALDFEREAESAEKELEYYRDNGVEVIALRSGAYPAALGNIEDPPLLLMAKGRVELLGRELLVGVVGTRKASNAGLTLAYAVARDLSRSGAVVVSGLAAGVDCYAHQGALEERGSTVAVLGNGIDVVYPKENAGMYGRVGKEGCLLTEFPRGTAPLKYNFPRRNRVISGLSSGIVVVEAERRSGALLTADHALAQGREVMAFPGRAGSEFFGGNNRLIKDGAYLVEDASDVLEILGREYRAEAETREVELSTLGRDILRVIGDEEVSIESIERILGCPVSRISSELTMLELKGAVVRHPGKIYSRASERTWKVRNHL